MKSGKNINYIFSIENIMGFDYNVMNKFIGVLGAWVDEPIPDKFVDFLPQELVFPLRGQQPFSPYDHRIHLLAREMASRLDEVGRRHDEVIKHCGYLLATAKRGGRPWGEITPEKELRSALHEEEVRLSFHQMTLLAEEYVQRRPNDIIGLCWRGQLAYWARDNDMALEYALRIWDETSSTSAEMIQRVTAFFALSVNDFYPEDEIRCSGWAGFAWSSLGCIRDTWIDSDQELVWAIVRRAFRQGTWDTPLLCSMMALVHHCVAGPADAADAPVECWCWLAQHWFQAQLGLLWLLASCVREPERHDRSRYRTQRDRGSASRPAPQRTGVEQTALDPACLGVVEQPPPAASLHA
jgi:hypothetical protein